MMNRPMLLIGATAIWLAAFSRGGAQAPPSARTDADWPSYRRDHAGTGYSPLAQITRSNVASLTEAWRFSLAGSSPAPTGG